MTDTRCPGLTLRLIEWVVITGWCFECAGDPGQRGCRGVPGTGLGARATGFGEAGVAEGADEQRHAAAVFHRLQLADIPDQDHLEPPPTNDC